MAGLAQALPPRLAGAVTAAADLVLAGLLIWVGIEVAALMSRQWAQTLSTLGLPRALTSLPVVWGMLSIAVSALLSAAAQARRAAAGERA
jgi:TRAP-type C4-dicarboxylate transport system permease small subunit